MTKKNVKPTNLKHTATYRVPIRYLNGNAAEMLFWDAVYYLLAIKGEWVKGIGYQMVETNKQELEALTGLSRKEIGKLRRKAANQDDPRYNILEEKGDDPGCYVLSLAAYETLLQKNVIEKPISYMANGWGPHLDYPEGRHSRFPLTVINHLLRLPPHLSVAAPELVYRCKHPQRQKPPDISEIHKALDLLQKLGLVEPITVKGEAAFRLIRTRFDTEAKLAWQQVMSKQNEPESIHQAREQDSERTKVALDLTKAGNFDPLAHFEEIFRDLLYIRSEQELTLLTEKVRKHHRKPVSPERWNNCWKQYQRELKRGTTLLTSEKAHLDLGRTTQQEVALSLPVTEDSNLVWAKLVLWLNTVQTMFYALTYTLNIRLIVEDKTIWQRTLTNEDEVVRRELTNQLRQHPQAICLLSVASEEPLQRVSLAAQLEAAIWQK